MIVDGQTVDYLDWSTDRSYASLSDAPLNLPEGEPVTGYKAFYRAAADNKLYPMEGYSIKKIEKGEAQPYIEDGINEYTPSDKHKSGGFYYWPTRGQAEEYLYSAMLHAQGYMYGTNFDNFQKDIPGIIEIHRVEGSFVHNTEGDMGNVMSGMKIMESVVSLKHSEAFPFNYSD